VEQHEDGPVDGNHVVEVDENGNVGEEVDGCEDDELGILKNDDGDERWNAYVVWRTTWSDVSWIVEGPHVLTLSVYVNGP